MAKNRDFFKNRVIISPFEARHFILTLPKVKKSYYENAVKFALRTVYPGDESSTKIDYFSNKEITIGIAANSSKIDDYKNKSKMILSPVLLVSNLNKTGISILEYDDWCEVLCTEKGIVSSIRDFKTVNLTGISAEIRKHLEEKKLNKITYYYVTNKNSDLFDEFKSDIHVENVNLLEIVNSNILNNSEIFRNKKKNRNFPYIVFLLFVILCGTWSIVHNHRKNEALIQKRESLKIEYNALKNENKMTENKNHQTIQLDAKYSLFDILCIIRSTSTSLKIDNITMNNNDIRIEACNSDALYILDKLAEYNTFTNLVLVQSIPQMDGTERFIITGKIKND